MSLLKSKWLYAGAVVAAALQTGILYASIEERASVLRSGHEVVLQTRPVDPRDLMRGDYVILGYDITSIDRKLINGSPVDGSRTVYVSLKPGDGGIWHVARASFTPFTDLALDEVQIRGESTYAISDYPDATLTLRYGIERYYVPEGEGRVIEDSQRDLEITAVVAVNDAGTAVIKALRDKGTQLYEEPLY
ncbi:GDYXXLXY domain-containing protein [Brucella pseudogrignonensis]|uniref:GDYXXLXY domain-containing protein n=1 Tax=Brucella pseudogrignonensis TaxID=419475 RepID=UPI0028B28E9E|nr:GDYXXLXY domain-containing protein [Brucella pseudogrignonensis]MDT6940673.1 GDYXXLXY domain-containing protein [Brucella pseudogrignonensis]